MGKLRFCIIGTGMIAERHIQAIRASQSAVCTAVFDIDPARAKAFAKTWSVPYKETFDAVLSDPKIDAVTIGTPTGTHLEVAVACAKAKKHILCEKPLEINVQRAQAIIDACKRNNVVLSAVFQSRFSKNVQQIKHAIGQGRFGRLLLTSAQIKWFRDDAYYQSSGGWRGTYAMDGGGVLMNQSIHMIDLLIWLTGTPVETYAYTNTVTHNIEAEDNASAIVRFANGASAVVQASTSCAPGFARILEISGEKGSIRMEDDRLTGWQFHAQTEQDRLIAQQGAIGEGMQSGSADPRGAGIEGHRRQIEDMVYACVTGEPPRIPGEEAIKAIRLICAIYQSHRCGKPIKIS